MKRLVSHLGLLTAIFCASLAAVTAQEKQVAGAASASSSKAIQETKAPQDPASDVKPSINKDFLDPNMKIEEWIGKFEIESREVFSARKEILETLKIKPGMRVADVGAGTGLYTKLFSREVGAEGWVYAVDISTIFLDHINEDAQHLKLDNITSVLCDQDSVNLPPESVDLVFVCDTYHHFEFYPETLASIKRALKPGGSLVIVDFERIEGKSRPWTMTHVRAGKEIVQSEIEEAGFELIGSPKLDGLSENYLLIFSRP
jgi:cyclopropane fatty-acyl-phospholipid synthase-like methyltransferase